LSFSRDFEREADRVGQVIMNDAGYDANAMASFFKRLQATNKFNDNGAYAFLRTHPVTAERVSEAEARARLMQVKMRPDSTSFLLIREKARIRQLSPSDAINFYQQAIKSKKYTSLDAQYYGLALAQLANQNIPAASLALSKIKSPEFLNHPAVISAKALILSAGKNYKQAANVYSTALDSYPDYKGLWIGQVDLYLNSKQLSKASGKLDSLGQVYPGDIDIWSRMASLYSDIGLNNQQKYLYAIGNKLYLSGEYRGAIEHYQQALQVKKGDAALNDVISAKVIDTREQIKLKSQFSQ
jgi:beta-barrel assembly-enhancing protease